MNPQTSETGSQRINGDGESPMDALRSAAQHLGEAKEYASNFIAAKVDATKLSPLPAGRRTWLSNPSERSVAG